MLVTKAFMWSWSKERRTKAVKIYLPPSVYDKLYEKSGGRRRVANYVRELIERDLRT